MSEVLSFITVVLGRDLVNEFGIMNFVRDYRLVSIIWYNV